MVEFIKRDKNDIFNKPLLGFLFKNKTFLFALRVVVAALFFYAVYYGFAHPGKENIFTGGLFWGIFWALFMVATLPTFGRIFCGICPHGFLGKYITKFGLGKTMPKWMQNRYIGITLLVVGWWGVTYTFPGFWKSPLATAAMFGGMTVIAFMLYFLFKDMSYCKYICPIGTLTRAYNKLGFTKLETYTQSCQDCRTFECASACSYNLKPFSFAKKNQMDDCTLCMDCAGACEAVKFSFTKPSEQLFIKFKALNAEVWTYILILASIPITMSFAHALGRSKIADHMIWNKTAAYFGMSEYAGGFAFLYALIFTIFISILGLFLAAKVLKKDYASTFSTLGYGYAPLFILGSLGHTLESFFTRGYQTIVTGFAQAFGASVEVAPLAQRGDAWLAYFGLLKWIGVIWTFILIAKRLKLIEATKMRKFVAYIFASFLVFFFIGVNLYAGYILKTYGAKQGHGMQKERGMAQGGGMHSKHGSKKGGRPSGHMGSFGAKTPLYISLTDPSKRGFSMGMHGMRDKDAIPTKEFWLVYGRSLEHKVAIPKTDVEFFAYDTNQNPIEVQTKNEKGKTSYKFEIPHSGYYNVFAVSKTQDIYKVAKLEYLYGQHGGSDVYTPDVKKILKTDKVPLDLIRIKNEDEDRFFYRHAMGDELTFQALFDGKPLANATLSIAMQSGWQKRMRTDKDGKVQFNIIRDYFPKDGEFDKRYKAEMLLTLNYEDVNKQKYMLTYPVSVYPNSDDYMSQKFALLLITLTLLVTGIIIYRFRKNRTKPFSELRYEE
ncbi:4Fe-4S binding protein [Sulfurimonas sp.]|uniref:4Fe-4S binding protein n=1 Tax=Sulfurimonas sp. TaxID=2022749 RepID=UPI003D099C31